MFKVNIHKKWEKLNFSSLNHPMWRCIKDYRRLVYLFWYNLYSNVFLLLHLSPFEPEWLPFHCNDPLRLVPGRAALRGGSGSEFRGYYTLRGAQQNQWHGYGCPHLPPSARKCWPLSPHLADGPVKCKGGLQLYSYGNKTDAVFLTLWRNVSTNHSLDYMQKPVWLYCATLSIHMQITNCRCSSFSINFSS